MTTLDHVADVETAARPAARSTDTKAALKYLEASGAVAITITENTAGCTFRVGTKLDPRVASVHWLRETEARAVLKAARKHAGASPDIATASTAPAPPPTVNCLTTRFGGGISATNCR
jgi:hypothetical protein